MPELITMREIADHLGTSVATVSKCLANKSDISEATRKRVLATCRKLGYRPNPLVSALMRSRRHRTPPSSKLPLAFVTAFPTADGWRQHPSPIFRQMFDGAKARAAGRDYSLEHYWLYREGMTNARFSQMLLARGVHGLLFAPVPEVHASLELEWGEFSTVALGLTPGTEQFHRVATDYYQSMLLAVGECVKRGYKRPGLAARLDTIKRLEHRWEAGYLIAREWFKLAKRPRPLLVHDWDEKEVWRWLDQEEPDVVIGPVHGRLESLIRGSGRQIPKTIGLVGLAVSHPGDRLSGILQDGEAIGAVAVDQLISLMERNDTGLPKFPITHTTLARWNPGRTVRAPSG